MSYYHHLSILERETLLLLRTQGKSIRAIAMEIGRSAPIISREVRRNRLSDQSYSAIAAQCEYGKRRKKFRRHKLLSCAALKETVARLFLKQQWSSEQIPG